MTEVFPNFDSILPNRDKDTHKGMFGRVGVIAGSVSMVGAALLAAMSALRSGAGLVYVMTVSEICSDISMAHPELITIPLNSESGFISSRAVLDIQPTLESVDLDVVVIGPGLGQSQSTCLFLDAIVPQLLSKDISIVLDADGLNNLETSILKSTPHTFVLTPHPGEFKINFSEFFHGSRVDMALESSRKLNQIMVLKGSQTVVSNGQDYYVNHTGNSGMSTAGTGDVLSGLVASFIGQGLSHFDAAIAAVYFHGFYGDKAYKLKGNGLIASDIIDQFCFFG